MTELKMFVLDVDGVMTDGSIYITDSGEEIKAFNSKDGQGIKLLMRAGVDVAIITGRNSKALSHRIKDLGITNMIQGSKNKIDALHALSAKTGVRPSQMAYMGDDVVDLPPMRACALSFAPADAMEAVRDAADHVTTLTGGHGAVREAIEIILRKIGKFDEVMARYVV